MDTSAVTRNWRVLEKLLKEVREQNRAEKNSKNIGFFAEEN